MIGSIEELTAILSDHDYHRQRLAIPVLKGLGKSIFYQIIIVDKQMQFLYLSANAAELFELPAEALIGRHWSDLAINLNVLPYIEGMAKHAFQSGLPCQGTCKSPFPSFPGNVYEFTLFPHPETSPHALIMFIRDVTEFQQSFEDLAYKNDQLNQLIAYSPFGIIVVNNEGTIEHINQPILQLAPTQLPSDYIGKHVSIIFDTTEGSYEQSIIAKALRGESTHQLYFKAKGRIFLGCAFPLRHAANEEIIGASAMYQDITDFEAMKSELVKYDRLNLVSEMAAGVAHEIRNPMTVVKGYLQLFQAKMPERFIEQFQLVLDELGRVETIITDFLSLAKNKSVILAPHNLNDIILKIAPLILSEGILHSTKVDFKLAEHLPLIHCDTREIKQLILNLCQNGIQAMVKGGELSISTSTENNCVLLRIADRGCGIPEEHLERIFDPFYTTKDTGTGLGLPVCRSITERHTGKIHITSTIGEGTEFVVSFPALRDEAAPIDDLN